MSTIVAAASVTERFGEAIERELLWWVSKREATGRHYDLLAYHMGWADEELRPASVSRGKRFRPLMCLLSCEAVGDQWELALPAAAAMEFLHNFSLIHDDIEDHDETRHHRPTLWKLCGDPLAINAGDAMLALAGLAALAGEPGPLIGRRFQETALALTEGQYFDMTFERQEAVSVPEYFRMIELKTAALIASSCELGGIVGAGTIDQVAALRSFGHSFGVAYQVFDDMRGIWASKEQTGKVEAKDIVNRKKSLPVLLALERSRGKDLDVLVSYYVHHQDADPLRIVQILDSLEMQSVSRRAMEERLEAALRALDGVGLHERARTDLSELARGLVVDGG